MNYQYVIIQGDADYYEMITQKTVNERKAVVITGLFQSSNPFLKKIILRLYYFLNHHGYWWALKIMLKIMLKIDLPEDKPVCFLIWSWYANDVNNYLGSYLRNKYKGCKIVCRFEDIIEKMPYKNIEDYRESFDYLISFDELEAKKYNIDYFPSWYDSCDDVDELEDTSDVLFIGRGKDRMSEILELFNKLESSGLNCYFYLVDVPEDKRKFVGKIKYGKVLPYKRVLEMVKSTKCLVEILQKEAESETLRVFEAITYGKKLLTNNPQLLNKSYYTSQFIQYYEDVNNINIDFIFDESIDVRYNKEIMEKFRPIKMLEYIDKII